MTQEPRKLIDLSVHETTDPNLLSRDQDQDKKSYAEIRDLNDTGDRDKNVDDSKPDLFDTGSDENLGDTQINIANLSAG